MNTSCFQQKRFLHCSKRTRKSLAGFLPIIFVPATQVVFCSVRFVPTKNINKSFLVAKILLTENKKRFVSRNKLEPKLFVVFVNVKWLFPQTLRTTTLVRGKNKLQSKKRNEGKWNMKLCKTSLRGKKQKISQIWWWHKTQPSKKEIT